MKAINVKLPDPSHALLRRLATSSGRTHAKIIELALAALERETSRPSFHEAMLQAQHGNLQQLGWPDIQQQQQLQQQADLGANALSLQGQSLNAIAAQGMYAGAMYGLNAAGLQVEAIGFDQQGRPVTERPSAGQEAMGVQGDPATARDMVHEAASRPADSSPGTLEYGEDDPDEDIATSLARSTRRTRRRLRLLRIRMTPRIPTT